MCSRMRWQEAVLLALIMIPPSRVNNAILGSGAANQEAGHSWHAAMACATICALYTEISWYLFWNMKKLEVCVVVVGVCYLSLAPFFTRPPKASSDYHRLTQSTMCSTLMDTPACSKMLGH